MKLTFDHHVLVPSLPPLCFQILTPPIPMALEPAAVLPPLSVEPRLWNALADPAAAARVPAEGSYIFFFPQGHAGKSSLPADLSAAFLCRVSSLRLLADPYTDEVFAGIVLDPRPATDPLLAAQAWMPVASSSSSSPPAIADGAGEGEFASYTKVLTQSDVSGGSGLTVPKPCELGVFPPILLHINRVPPAEDVSALDVHGRAWNFRLVFGGRPQRHRLTKCSDFATAKRLVKGDTVVFAKYPSGDIYIGVQRTGNSSDTATRRASMQAASVAEAIELAREGLSFEVAYYPREGSPEHVVAAVAMPHQISWAGGAAQALPNASEANPWERELNHRVSEVPFFNRVKRSRDEESEDHDNCNFVPGRGQSPGASTRSFKLFGQVVHNTAINQQIN